MPFESTIQYDMCFLLDFSLHVIYFETEPLTIEYFQDGRRYQYTPDILVRYVNRNDKLIECKPEEFVGTKKNQRKFAAATRYCFDQRIEFEVATAEQIREGWFLPNVKRLSMFAERDVDDNRKLEILDMVSGTVGSIPLLMLARLVDPNDPGKCLGDIHHMLYHQQLYVSLSEEEISNDSLIFPPRDAVY